MGLYCADSESAGCASVALAFGDVPFAEHRVLLGSVVSSVVSHYKVLLSAQQDVAANAQNPSKTDKML